MAGPGRKYDPKKRHRRSIRLPDFDYAANAAYFVTMVTHGRRCLFGRIADGRADLSRIGEIVRDEWRRTASVRPGVVLDEFVVMPNHVHGIMILEREAVSVGVALFGCSDDRAPLRLPAGFSSEKLLRSGPPGNTIVTCVEVILYLLFGRTDHG